MYAVLDIETTGGKYNEEGITEIAIYRFDGQQVIDKFISLVNPERPIENFVVKLTGISNKMLRNAPKFYQLAKRIIEITEDCILVTHNAAFDYRILQTEFRRLGYDYQRSTLCTVQLSKKLLPDAPAYNLEKLARFLAIPLVNRHRASGDALATLELFKILIDKDLDKNITTEFVKQNSEKLPKHLLKILDTLPNDMGSFYMYNSQGMLLFMGRAKNIKRAVSQVFTSEKKQSVKITKSVHKVVFELSGTQLIAQIKELQEIQQNSPLFKSKIKPVKPAVALVKEISEEGYILLKITELSSKLKPEIVFQSQVEAQNFLQKITTEFTLCLKYVGLSQAKKSCSLHLEGNCNGACVKAEKPEVYNERVLQALKMYSLKNQTIAIVDKGRKENEKSVLLIEKGVFKGYGYIHLNYQLHHAVLKNVIVPVKNRMNIRYLVENYFIRRKFLKIISL